MQTRTNTRTPMSDGMASGLMALARAHHGSEANAWLVGAFMGICDDDDAKWLMELLTRWEEQK